MAQTEKIDAATVRSLLDYNSEAGVFLWKERKFICKPRKGRKTWNEMYAGKSAGHVDFNGYLVIPIKRVNCYARRLAWLWVNGEWPELKIDHINGVKKDNRIANLRPVDDVANSINRGMHSNNTKGHKGIGFDKRKKNIKKPWIAYIQRDSKIIRKMVGTKEEAIILRQNWEKEIHGEYARAG